MQTRLEQAAAPGEIRRAADTGASDDVITQLMSRQVLAKVAARRGRFEQARAMAAEVLALADGMQAPLSQGDACLDVAEVLRLAGDHDGAVRQAERAAWFYRGKGATVPLERALRLAEVIGSEGGEASA